MTSLFRYFKGWVFVLPMLILAAGTAAQQPDAHSLQGMPPGHRSLEIRNGAVFLDGRQLDPGDLPEGFPPEGAAGGLTVFASDRDVVLQLQDGRRYALEGDSLWLKTPADSFDCLLRDGGCAGMGENAMTLFIDGPPPEAILEQKAEILFEQAKRMQDLQHRFAEGRTSELQQMMEEMTLHAEEAARTASEFPDIHMQRYFQGVQDMDKALFDRLMREQRMEREASIMARKFAAMEEGKARRDSIDALRERLTEIFELKQENRRREMEQLEEKLQELQEAVSERERFRDRIVERRLQELLGNDTLDW